MLDRLPGFEPFRGAYLADGSLAVACLCSVNWLSAHACLSSARADSVMCCAGQSATLRRTSVAVPLTSSTIYLSMQNWCTHRLQSLQR